MRTRWRIFFGVITLVILIYFLRKIDFLKVWDLIIRANHLYFFLAFVAYGMSFLVFNIRSMYLLKKVVKPNFWFSLETTFAGFFINSITPGAQLGGDPLRAYFLGQKYKKRKTKIFGALLADRFFHVIASIFFIIAALLFILTYVPVSFELRTIFQTVLFFVLFFSLVIAYLSFRKSNFDIELFLARCRWLLPGDKPKNGHKTKLERILIRHFTHFARTFRTVIRDKKMIFVGITLSLIYWLLNFAASYLLFFSFGFDISFLIVIVVFSIGNLVGDFSPSPGGIGLIEGASIITYSILGIPLLIAIAVSLLTRIIFYIYSLLIGGLSLVHLEHTVG